MMRTIMTMAMLTLLGCATDISNRALYDKSDFVCNESMNPVKSGKTVYIPLSKTEVEFMAPTGVVHGDWTQGKYIRDAVDSCTTVTVVDKEKGATMTFRATGGLLPWPGNLAVNGSVYLNGSNRVEAWVSVPEAARSDMVTAIMDADTLAAAAIIQRYAETGIVPTGIKATLVPDKDNKPGSLKDVKFTEGGKL
ncbi:MAG: hypothetical protein HQL09_09730 [Nitrospirae bacterium]|nr:hypothetical protein [Nitrospirota bacterium]